jgi:hypothetical protein
MQICNFLDAAGKKEEHSNVIPAHAGIITEGAKQDRIYIPIERGGFEMKVPMMSSTMGPGRLSSFSSCPSSSKKHDSGISLLSQVPFFKKFHAIAVFKQWA